MTVYYAHSDPKRRPCGRPDATCNHLADHLTDVSVIAAGFAAPFSASDEAAAAGLLHDLGKYGELFQDRLRGTESGIDHWSVGAWLLHHWYGRRGVSAAALAVQGHHIGLAEANRDALDDLRADKFSARHPDGPRLSAANPQALLDRLRADGLALPQICPSIYSQGEPCAAGMLDVRMLFSTLVDADFLATEAHFNRDSLGAKHFRPPGAPLEPGRALRAVAQHIEGVAATSKAAPAVNALRADLLAACLTSAVGPRGCYTLTAPTGAGKTLAMLAFALRHAEAHGLRRVVIVLPFLSIIDQTARVLREVFEPVFGDGYVLEHHSLSGTRDGDGEARDAGTRSTPKSRAELLAENWDAPIVVTTSVQCLESLFANRPAACRKLHRLADSVVLFDEVQTLPVKLAVPTLATLARLAERYGTSVVFSTATQPAFERLHDAVTPWARPGWAAREVVPAALDLFARARRVEVRWPDRDEHMSWDAVAAELAAPSRVQVLCVVNLKRHAVGLIERVIHLLADISPEDAGIHHLSTALCPAHRERVLAEVRTRLLNGRPCRLIATQCVEAGVDLDFPEAFRAFGPLDAVTQVAGRCNRGGTRASGGTLHVFRPERDLSETGKPRRMYPDTAYEAAAGVTEDVLHAMSPEGVQPHNPEAFRRYYERLYGLSDPASQFEKLGDAMRRRHFGDAAREYRLIDKDAVNVLVPYDPVEFRALRDEVRERRALTRDWIRRARPHVVSVYRPRPGSSTAALLNLLDPVPLGFADERSDEWFILIDEELYDPHLHGLRTPTAEEAWIA